MSLLEIVEMVENIEREKKEITFDTPEELLYVYAQYCLRMSSYDRDNGSTQDNKPDFEAEMSSKVDTLVDLENSEVSFIWQCNS
eukprot:1642737-Ditylum_brightwellii.AAC.1